MPRRRKCSMVRAWHRSIFGRNEGSGRLSINRHSTPRCPRSMASVKPTGPPPTIKTGGSLTRVLSGLRLNRLRQRLIRARDDADGVLVRRGRVLLPLAEQLGILHDHAAALVA